MIRLMLIPFLMLAVGCSASVKVKRMAQVKRVAIVGFGLEKEEKQAEGLMALANLAAKAASGDFFGAAQASYGYELLRQRLGAGTGWTIIAQAEVVANPEYQKILEEESGAMSALAKLGGQATPEGILGPGTASGLSDSQRRVLMKALKVDAVIYVGSRIRELDSFSIGPVGWSRYKSTAWLYAYDTRDDETIWQDNGAIGESTKDVATFDLGDIGTVGEDPEPMLMRALELSYEELVKRYKEAMKKG